MKIFKQILGLTMGFLLSVSSFADGPGWTNNSTVVKVVLTVNGGVNVRLSPDIGGCVSQSGYGPIYASVYPSHPGIDKIYSALLSAYMSGETVAIYLSDDDCTVGEVQLGGI